VTARYRKIGKNGKSERRLAKTGGKCSESSFILLLKSHPGSVIAMRRECLISIDDLRRRSNLIPHQTKKVFCGLSIKSKLLKDLLGFGSSYALLKMSEL
jgi:hypothetical protein